MQLKRILRNFFCYLLALILIFFGFVKKAKTRSFQNDTILPIYFHNPNKHLFRKIILWLKNNGYIFISCEQLIDILHRRIPCPKGAVWLSFDDGWKENIENVIPLALEYDIPITIFIYTSAIETGSFWWESVRRHSKELPAKYQSYEKVMYLPEDTRKQVLNIVNNMKTSGSLKRDAMTIEDIRRISNLPQVTLGSHTVTHPLFENCTDTQIDYELGESKNKLEDMIKKPVKAFAYPGGSYTDRAKPLLKKHGYEIAVTIVNKLAKIEDDCYLIPRTDVMDDGSFAENLCHVLGIWEPLVNKLKHFIPLLRL